MLVCVVLLKFWSSDSGENQELTQSEIDSYVAEAIKKVRPIEEPANGYLGSSSCGECHENQHASWHASYHRTMTQVATPETVLGNFDNQQFTFPKGFSCRIGKTDDAHWVEFTDHPEMRGKAKGDPVRRPVVLTTGSHHMQAYWFATGHGRELGLLPLVYLKVEERWIPRSAAFIESPDETHNLGLNFGRWGRSCSTCHTTDPRASFQKESHSFDTKVSEFGISCESCHGPGEAHVNFQGKRKESPGADLTDGPDPIVNPSTLDHRKSSQICGACHVQSKPDKFVNYIPGTDYDKARTPMRMSDEFMNEHMGKQIDEVMAQLMDSRPAGVTNTLERRSVFKRMAMRNFWPDGTIRVGGREYSGLIQSACHTKGQMSCISCHSMHQSGSDKRMAKEWADDQLHPSRQGDQACLQCHEATDYRSTEHTHHPLNSAGSSCYNCHMPHSSYGLLKSTRSHTIDSPKIDVSDEAGRPNACNLCHLDQTLEWTSKHLADWYDIPMPALTTDQRQVAAGPLWTLQGDAGLRALMAWHIGWQPARDAAATDWSAPYLSVLMDDPYPAVRIIASRTMKKFPPYRQIAYDFLAQPEQRRAPALQLVTAWQQQQSGKPHSPATLIGPDGKPQMQRIQTLLKTRDLRPVNLAE